MRLKILLPGGVLADQDGVAAITAETRAGSMGILPRRLDFVASLIPGILVYRLEAEEGRERYAAVDEGVLVKADGDVLVSVRNGMLGMDLVELRHTVEAEFLRLDERERNVRTALARLESDVVRRFVEFGRNHG